MVNGVLVRLFKEQKEQFEKERVFFKDLINTKVSENLQIIVDYIRKVTGKTDLSINPKPEKKKKEEEKPKKITIFETKHKKVINSLCFLKDKRLASCSKDESIIVYNPPNYGFSFRIDNAHETEIGSICGLSNGNLVSGDNSGKIYVWNINDTKYKVIQSLTGHNGEIEKIIELEDKMLCTCSSDCTAITWEKTNEGRYKRIGAFTGHDSSIVSVLEFKGNIISSSYDEYLKIWNKRTFGVIKEVKGVICNSRNGLSIADDDTVIMGNENTVYIVNLQNIDNQKNLTQDKYENKELKTIFSLKALSKDKIFIGNNEGILFCLSLSSKKILSKSKIFGDRISCIILSDDNKLLLSSKVEICVYNDY